MGSTCDHGPHGYTEDTCIGGITFPICGASEILLNLHVYYLISVYFYTLIFSSLAEPGVYSVYNVKLMHSCRDMEAEEVSRHLIGKLTCMVADYVLLKRLIFVAECPKFFNRPPID
jgi:hypothetical protein